jgi:ABC-type ATPase involved in cell division
METQMVVDAGLRLSAQRALLGRIYPEMRLIKVKSVDDCIVITVVMTEEPKEHVREAISIAAAEIISDFPNANKIIEKFEVSGDHIMPEDVLTEGWIYLRAE